MIQAEKTYISTTSFFSIDEDTYLFDDVTGLVIQIPASDRVKTLELFKNSADPSSFIQDIDNKIQEKAVFNLEYFDILKVLCTVYGSFFRPVRFELPELTADGIEDVILKDGLVELILEVTSSCNLRCKYCVFGGNYEGYRSHSNTKMTIETAHKAIDMYFKYLDRGKLRNFKREPAIAFYGGEPLLNFNLIKETVLYAKEKYSEEYEIHFTLTTNGTLLGSPEIIDFLLQNNFAIFISLDGPADVQNRNRVFANGTGTFDVIIGNIEKIKARKKDLGINDTVDRLFATATYDPKTDLRKVKAYFDEKSSLPLMFYNGVRPFKTTYYQNFVQSDYEKFFKDYTELKNEFFTYVPALKNSHDTNHFFNAFFGLDALLHYSRTLITRQASIYLPFTKTCFPGFKIFVDCEGGLHPCERTPTNIKVGHVDTGLDFEGIKNTLTRYQKMTAEKCKECKIAFSCGTCIACLYLEGNEDACTASSKAFFTGMELALQTLKHAPKYFEQVIEHFEKVQREMA